MSDPELDRAARILADSGRVVMPVHDLATSLHPYAGALRPGGTGDAGTAATSTLTRRLRADDRFVVFETSSGFAGAEAWTESDRAAYAPTLREVLPDTALVLLRHGSGPIDGPEPLHRLLHRTLLGLVALPAAPRLAAAAEEARSALTATSSGIPEKAPSTTLPPGRPPPG
jgi:hypothetical protein